ncbi:MAG: hypothetical protein BZ151_05325 [Desulfobacca sp. 4484_104]|nr:MAG: hypothetical protein BZ151_05325 [Desulfobacca sp. 4484_104]RLA90400.1 MAG: DUF1844 domain-containing protein [Deltaproteobacteria bacterium]
MAETEDKGYTVKDKRFFFQSEEEKARLREETRSEGAAAAAASEEGKSEAESRTCPLPEITFSSFLISLSSSAFLHLGDLPDPATGETKKDLPLAKQTIDLLGLLREKTRNNLTTEEENLFDHLLYDLRMRYVKEVSCSGG